MPEFNVEVVFEVFCNTCHAGLCGNTTVRATRNGGYQIHVAPCSGCMNQRYEEGHDEGYSAGHDPDALPRD